METIKVGAIELQVAPVTLGACRDLVDPAFRRFVDAQRESAAIPAEDHAGRLAALRSMQAAAVGVVFALASPSTPGLDAVALERQFPGGADEFWDAYWAVVEASGYGKRGVPGEAPRP